MSVNLYEDPEIVRFVDDAHKLMLETLRTACAGDTKVIEFVQPEQLQDLLHLEIGPDPEPTSELLEHCKRVIKYSVKTCHPCFMNQLYSGVEPHSLVGAWLTDTLSTNIHTFEVCPTFILMEKYILQKLCRLIGFKDGDGIFCPGGSLGNIMALHLARYKLNPESRRNGMYGQPKMKLYTSEEAHYSLVKGAAFLGFGSDSVVTVKTDQKGKMITEDLERRIQEDKAKGHRPLMVMATSGTTVLGAYDPLMKIADICEKNNMWMHCDASWGGGVLVSEKLRHRVDGIERSDSVMWNLHKMNGAILQCGALVLKQKGLQEAANSLFAEYLFQPDKNYDTSYDTGDKTVQTGRKVDVFKLWLLWKAKGDRGMAERVEKMFDNVRYITEKMKHTEGFQLCIPEFESLNVCFWYIPPSLRGQEQTKEWWEKISKVTSQIKTRMMEKGSMMIGFTPLTTKGFVNFFRAIIDNPLQDHSTMDYVVQEIDRLGGNL